MKKVIKSLENTLNKDATRASLNGYYHNADAKALITTNGLCMTVSHSLFCPELGGLSIVDDGMNINHTSRPNMAPLLLPEDKSSFQIFDFKIAPHFYVKKVKGQEITKIHFTKNGPSFDKSEEILFTINSEFLKIIADGSTYSILFKNDKSPIYFSLKNDFTDYLIIMPMR